MRANVAGLRLVGFLTGSPDFEIDRRNPLNLADALLSPDALRPLIENWHEVASYFIRTIRSDAIIDGGGATATLLSRLLDYPDVRDLAVSAVVDNRQDPVLTMDIRKLHVRLRLFTTLAIFGTPLEVAAEEVRVESFFPADEPTASIFHNWADPPK